MKRSDKSNPASFGRDCLFFLVIIVEGSSDSSTILGILRNMETDVVQLLQSGEDFLALGEQREVANQHEIADIAA